MEIKKFKDTEELSRAVAKYITALIKNKPEATLVLTSGDTPKRAYQLISEMGKSIDFSKCMIIGLDEWVGVGPKSEGSCRYIVEESLLKPLNISEENYTFFDSLSSDLATECKRVDKLILDRGGLDFIIVGIGLNGHIGLNEPGYAFGNYCHVTDLAQMTIDVGQKYFEAATPLSKGITVGLKHLLEAKTAMLMASGEKKAAIISQTVSSQVSPEIPSTVFQLHKDGLIWLDDAAGSMI
ncbi:6-phosphogluconolactonase [Arcticibacterium luteifluviistationis]|uniref:Glucosamine-6-phosphate deaminase n=1 Tax=Arcticibacterium luteifluviistationis TaxID=1784714 RepID=A0A2Z4GHF7_9BACT|nr:glucosamine-6-phosphate deaminase [Arcticibacterium luteifluviistationis]AWW00466.1 glucosamine-6-phosphate deaminase [Arcticibacterium luteifluviistationis]